MILLLINGFTIAKRSLFLTIIFFILLCNNQVATAQWYHQVRGISVTPSVDTFIKSPGVNYRQVMDTLQALAGGVDTTEGGTASKLRVQDLFWSQRVSFNDSSGHNMFDEYLTALRATVLAGRGACTPDAAKWECLGPDNLPVQAMGYVRSVWADTGVDSNFILAGSERGGLFKTTDGGANWENITDNAPVVGGIVGIECITVNPLNKNTIYLGTEYGGILKSFDRGATWQQEFIGLGDFFDSIASVFFVYMRPDSLRLYAFMADSVYTRSNAAGASHVWQNITPAGSCGGTRWTDLEFVPGNSNHFFISNTYFQNPVAAYQGIYYATDSIPAPASWTEITSSLADYVGVEWTNSNQWSLMKMSMPDADTLFFSAFGKSPRGANIYSYSISGNSFIKLHDSMPYESYDFLNGKSEIIVTPINSANYNKRNIYFGWDKPYQSWDGGTTFVPIGSYWPSSTAPTHGDIRCLYLQKQTNTLRGSGDRLFIATDGGVSKKPAGWDPIIYSAGTTIDISGKGLNCGEFVGFASSETGGKGIGGSMHNGIFTYEPSQTTKWQSYGINDSWNAEFDRKNQDTAYVWDYINLSTLWKVFKNTSTGRMLGSRESVYPTPLDTVEFYKYPILGSDYSGYTYSIQHRLWVKTQSLPFGVDPSYGFPNPTTFYQTPRARAIANDPGSLDFNGYILYDNNRIYYSTPLLTAVTTNPVPASSAYPVISVATDPRNTNRVWVTQGGVNHNNLGDTHHRVYYSQDHGTMWVDVSKGLPQRIAATQIVYDEVADALYCATDAGIYRCDFSTFDLSDTSSDAHGLYSPSVEWTCFNKCKVSGKEFPNAWVTSLIINRCEGKLYAATYGRSLWATDLPPIGPDAEHSIEITTNTTWNSEKWVTSPVRVKAGAILSISGATIHMPANASIMVEQGAKLLVTNARLTNSCVGCLWGGIQAWGDNTHTQSTAYQGFVRIENSTIEHAKVGVINCNPNPALVNVNGGIIQASGSLFLNNATAAVFKDYRNLHPVSSVELPDVSYFTNCSFYIDNGYKGTGAWLTPARHISLEGIYGLNIRGCSFNNRHSIYRGTGSGIYAVKSGFSVVPYCYAATTSGCLGTSQRCRFNGLTHGVYIAGAGLPADPTASIDQADFDSVSIGVYVSAQRHVSVTRCNMNIGRGIIAPFVGVGGAPLGCGRNIGVFTQNSPVFRIEENTFTGLTNSFAITPWYNAGVLAANAGNATNRVYRNTFTGLSYGVLGLGNNATGYPALSGYGLQVSCNSFSSNTNDIYAGGTGGMNGIGLDQRGPTYYGEAGNTFSGSVKNIVNTNPLYTIYYSRYGTGSISTSGLVTIYSGAAEACASTIPPPVTRHPSYMSAPPTALDETMLDDYKAAYYTARNNRTTALAAYNAAIDRGGKTDSLLTFIDTCANMDTFFRVLNDISPFLSQAVLNSAASTAAGHNYAEVLTLLALNPEVIRDYSFLSALATRISMSNEDFETLVTESETNTDRGTLEQNVAMAQSAMDENVNIILMALRSPIDTNVSVLDTTHAGICMDTSSVYYLVDTNSYYRSLDTVEQWLKYVGTPNATYERVGIVYLRGELQDAITLFNSIDSSRMTPAEKEEYIDYYKTGAALYSAATDGRGIFTLNETEISLLDTSGDFEFTSNAARIAAWNLKVNPIVHFPCASLPPVARAGSTPQHPPFSAETSRFQRVKVYPNPSAGTVTFEYNLPSVPNEKVTITVLNMLGEKVMEQEANGNTGKILWQPGALASGMYIYQVTGSRGIAGKGKLVLTR